MTQLNDYIGELLAEQTIQVPLNDARVPKNFSLQLVEANNFADQVAMALLLITLIRQLPVGQTRFCMIAYGNRLLQGELSYG